MEYYDIVLFDISSFFLYGRLSAPVYMEQQAEWVTPDKPKQDYICQVNGNMYGLVMAPHIAQKELVDTLTDQGKFKPTASDDCIFLANDPQTRRELPSLEFMLTTSQLWEMRTGSRR